MPLLKRKRVFAAAVESAVGTAETLDAGDGVFNAYELMIQPTITVEEREAQGSFNYLRGVPGARQGKATFKTEVGWDGTATLPNWAEILLPACGWVKSSTVFTPRSEAPGSNVKTLTIGAYIDGVLKMIAGAAGTFKLNCPAGRLAFIEWEFTGVWQEVTDVAMIAPTYPATSTPIRFADSTVTFASVEQCLENMVVDAGNNVILRECSSTEAGYISGLITNRYPKVTGNPESVLVATEDRFGDWLAATEGALAFTLKGPGTSTIAVSCPKAQITNIQEGDRNGLVIDQIEWACNKNGATADQELSITFTPTV